MEIALPVFAIIGLLLAWEFAIDYFNVPLFMMPKPSDFIHAIRDNIPLLAHHSWETARIIIAGFVISALIAVPLAFSIVSIKVVEEALYPLIVFFKLIPKTITGPLLLLWLGLGDSPKIVLVVMITSFPILIDSMTGFRSVPQQLEYIAKSTGASALQAFWYIRFPSAMPFIVSGLKIGMVSAVTAAIIAEFIGSSRGLGFLIIQASTSMDTPLMFAAIIAVAVVGSFFSLIIVASEKLLMPWMQVRTER